MIMLIHKSHEHAAPHEQEALISLKQAIYDTFV